MSRALSLFLLVATVMLAGCGSAAAPHTVAPASSIPQPSLAEAVSVQQASALRDLGAFVLDVREPSEYSAVHIPGATLIPLGQLPSRLSEVPHDRTVVVVCHSGNRSAQGRDILRQAGFSNATSMSGGMSEWQAAGLPTTTGPG